ncbi:MAG: hypothetical protein HY902_03820 [Deltaproteobacteria bacterium]|nr:hypothetical protein [Deltaproteobacteria bacterium]
MKIGLGSAVLALVLLACGDPPLSAAVAAADAGDSSQTDVQIHGDVAGPDSTAQDGNQQSETAAGDGGAQDAPLPDTAQPDAAVADTAAPDVPPSDVPGTDVGMVDFVLLASDPTHGAAEVPAQFAAKLTFSTALKAVSASNYTITVTGPGGTAIPVTFAVTGATLTIAAKQPAPLASRVDIVLGPLVQSAQGVPLAETKLSFYTQGPENTQGYAKLAARFAPLVRQAFATSADQLRALDYDNNWQVADNLSNLNKFVAGGQVVWAAVETRSHVYLTYAYYWPERKGVAPGVPVHNDVSGAQVVVERQSGLPVALQTYFKAKTDEPMWLWVATEAGWPQKSKYVRAFWSRNQIFPPDQLAPECQPTAPNPGECPRHFPAYLTAASHQSCLWSDAGESSDQQCVASDYVKSTLKLLLYSQAATAGDPPMPTSEGAPAAYTLRPLLNSWWLHRDETGPSGLFVDTQFKYAAASGRPAGLGESIGSRFASDLDNGDFGRPPWAWTWHPTVLSASYYDLPRGTPFYDPAGLLYNRLGGAAAGMPAWDAAKKTGFSTDYCFNPYLGIDKRDTPECQL